MEHHDGVEWSIRTQTESMGTHAGRSSDGTGGAEAWSCRGEPIIVLTAGGAKSQRGHARLPDRVPRGEAVTPSHDGCMRKGAAGDQAAGATLSWSEVSHADDSYGDGPLATVPA
jgi:hypothetical protein